MPGFQSASHKRPRSPKPEAFRGPWGVKEVRQKSLGWIAPTCLRRSKGTKMSGGPLSQANQHFAKDRFLLVGSKAARGLLRGFLGGAERTNEESLQESLRMQGLPKYARGPQKALSAPLPEFCCVRPEHAYPGAMSFARPPGPHPLDTAHWRVRRDEGRFSPPKPIQRDARVGGRPSHTAVKSTRYAVSLTLSECSSSAPKSPKPCLWRPRLTVRQYTLFG